MDLTILEYAKLCKMVYNYSEHGDLINNPKLKYEIIEIELTSKISAIILKFKNEIVISLPGVSTPLQVIQVSMVNQIELHGTKIHNGFFLYYRSIKDPIIKFLADYKDYKISFTGHSLGSVVLLFALSNELRLYEFGKIVLFGAPKIGDEDFVRLCDANFPLLIRVANPHDIITLLPLNKEYSHTKNVLYVDNINWVKRIVNTLKIFKNISKSEAVLSELFQKCYEDHSTDKYIKLLDI